MADTTQTDAPPVAEPAMDFEAAMDRIRAVTSLRTQVELAGLLGIRQSSISDAKRRKSIPDAWLVTLLERYAANPAWIKTGEGAAWLRPDPDRAGPTGWNPPPAEPAPAPPEPSVAELVAALEAKLGGGMRVQIVGRHERALIVPMARAQELRGATEQAAVLDEYAYAAVGR